MAIPFSNSSTSMNVVLEELDETFTMADQPNDINVKLWPHQRTLLERCLLYENEAVKLSCFKNIVRNRRVDEKDSMRTRIGVIGDVVGAGKSFVLLSLVNNSVHANLNDMPITRAYGDNKVLFSFGDNSRRVHTSLLVIPHNLVSQWNGYIKQFSDRLNVLLVHREKHIADLLTALSDMTNVDLIVVSATYYNRVASAICGANLKLQRVIFDEVDNVNIPNCAAVDSNFYWFVTATYNNLLFPRGYYTYDTRVNKTICCANGIRNAGFIKTIFMDLFDHLSLEFVKILVLKNNSAYVESSIRLPPPNLHYIQCTSPVELRVLNGYADHDVIRCLNAQDLTTALRLINPNQLNTEESLIDLQIARYSKEVHNLTVRIECAQTMEFDTEELKAAEVKKLETKRMELEVKIDGIRSRIQNADTCCICYEDFRVKTISPCCSNAFCFACMKTWLTRNAKCPLCKAELMSNNLMIVDDGVEPVQDPSPSEMELSNSHDKLKNLRILLTKKLSPNAKVLIFSSFEMSFTSISRALNDEGMNYKCLKGNDYQIRSIIRQYKEEGLNIMFVNARYFGSGMNLENTTDIVMFHKLDSEIEKQVIGRAQRYGRERPLNIWYLLHENEMQTVAETR